MKNEDIYLLLDDIVNQIDLIKLEYQREIINKNLRMRIRNLD